MAVLLLLLVVVLCRAVWRADPQRALWILVLTVVLVPGSLPVPLGPGVLTVHRAVLVAALAGLLRRTHRGELPWTVWSLPPVGQRLLLLVGVAALLGVGLVQPETDPGSAARNWQDLVAQAVFLLAFLVLLRASPDPLAGAKALAIAALLAAGIAVLERLTGSSYARAWFRAAPSLLDTEQAQRLAVRGGEVRVRAAADFTLAYAWTAAAAVPVLVVLATLQRRARPWLLFLGLPLLLLTVVLTYTRSVIAPLLAVVLLIAAVLRDSAVRAATAAAVVVGFYAVLSSTSLEHQFTAAVDQGSIDVRVERLPVIGDLLAHHAYGGLGISGLFSQGIPATDSSYVLTYAELGVIGLAVLAAVLLCAVGGALAGTRSRVPEERLVALGAGLGALLLVAGSFTFDCFSSPASAETFWLLVALGLVAGDGQPGWAHAPGPRTRAALVLGAVALGLGLRWTAPTHVAQTWQFESLATYPATVAAATFTGTQLRATACRTIKQALPDTTQTCASSVGPGQGVLRLEAKDLIGLEAARSRAITAVHAIRPLSQLRLMPRGPAEEGTPTPLRTAPVWLAVFAATVLVPLRRP